MTQQKEKKEMLTVSELPDGRKLVSINYSSLSIIQACLRKAHYALDRDLRGEGSIATLFGSAIHSALETWYKSEIRTRKVPVHHLKAGKLIALGHEAGIDKESAFYQAIKSFHEFGAKNEFLDVGEPLTFESARSLESGGVILANYFKKYQSVDFVVMHDSQGPLIERKMRFVLYEDEELVIEYHGTLDMILQHKATRNILICDHKTSSRLGNDFFNRLNPNHQYTGYLLAAKKCLGIDTDNFLVNALGVYKKMSDGSFNKNCLRQITTRTKADYESFVRVVVYETKRYLQAKEAGFWPQTSPDPCAQWGGCQFLKVCEVPSKIRAAVIQANWKEQ